MAAAAVDALRPLDAVGAAALGALGALDPVAAARPAALGAFDTPYVNFGFTAPSKPCQLTGLAELAGEPLTDYRHVIMLMRLPT